VGEGVREVWRGREGERVGGRGCWVVELLSFGVVEFWS